MPSVATEGRIWHRFCPQEVHRMVGETVSKSQNEIEIKVDRVLKESKKGIN